jgi:predicted dehydrogenase
MNWFDRREFLRQTSAITAALATTHLASAADEKPADPKNSSGDKLRVAVVGVRGRGMSAIQGFTGKNGCVVTTVCDADSGVITPAMKYVEMTQKQAPTYVQDVRKVIEDKNIDIISIATPNHWHALMAVWALQAGKHVYVEKPVSHNVLEGRRIVEAARKYKRICQTGTQSRSMTGMRAAIEHIHTGKIGKVNLAYGVCFKRRGSIGKVMGEGVLPKGIDYNLWCGPAPMNPLKRKNLHYDWHWTWDYGNGDLGNQGIHEMDKARWGLNQLELPQSVFSLGGRFGYEDDGETANTQLCVFNYGAAKLLFEVRGLESTSPYLAGAKLDGKKGGNFVGNIWFGDKGTVVCPSYNSGIALNAAGEIVEKFSGGNEQLHYDNFVRAVRANDPKLQNAEILEGHLSSALCHLGNISLRLGKDAPLASTREALSADKPAADALGRMLDHLREQKIDLDATKCKVGRTLTLDPKTETFVNDKEADALLTREYRKGFELPAQV